LGSGGYGEVFCVDEWTSTNGKVALKKAKLEPAEQNPITERDEIFIKADE